MERERWKNEKRQVDDASLSGLKGEAGFTYLELVIAMSVLLILLPALFFITRTFMSEIKGLDGKERLVMESMAFSGYIHQELKQGSHFRMDNGSLYFQLPNGDTVCYRHQKRRVIRSVRAQGETAFKGNTILLQDVYYIAFVPDPVGVGMKIGMQNWNASLDWSTYVAGRVRTSDEAE
ncbi:hypothetical protein [Thermoactinomyces sp. CICC 10523]|jgi:hypothetical protein|uniref:hypothetical protein n=1 Tax=Thermoactinomyces sp. CICC 10523 TaxID=2767428 RepID=UPI0018DD671F|nr:hypothetical protein [Thermoactinomyces sp. CICC 10523]MBH8597453.1 hypothetical protein [Thermoactinomyces sp. CICC 10523]